MGSIYYWWADSVTDLSAALFTQQAINSPEYCSRCGLTERQCDTAILATARCRCWWRTLMPSVTRETGPGLPSQPRTRGLARQISERFESSAPPRPHPHITLIPQTARIYPYTVICPRAPSVCSSYHACMALSAELSAHQRLRKPAQSLRMEN